MANTHRVVRIDTHRPAVMEDEFSAPEGARVAQVRAAMEAPDLYEVPSFVKLPRVKDREPMNIGIWLGLLSIALVAAGALVALGLS